jgi:hypothetical protein
MFFFYVMIKKNSKKYKKKIIFIPLFLKKNKIKFIPT